MDRNNKIFLLWELTAILCKLREQIFFSFVHQHGGNAHHLLVNLLNFVIISHYHCVIVVVDALN